MTLWTHRLAGLALGGGIVLAPALPHAHDPITTRVTWTGEIARILEARCVTCHSPGGRGPMSLASYADARPWARAIKEEVMTRRMPKWHAARGYGDFANDPSLSPFEIALVVAWADGGAPLGADRTTVPVSAPAAPTIEAERERKIWGFPVVCGDRPLPTALLMALRPELEPGASVGIAVRLPDGRREILAWIRDYDPQFAQDYVLRAPLQLPAGSHLITEHHRPPSVEPRVTASEGRCVVHLTLRESR